MLRTYRRQLELHTLNFPDAPKMKATPARRVKNMMEPIARRFPISRTFFFLSDHFVKDG